MVFQTIQTLKSPVYGALSLIVGSLFGLTLLYFDEFVFFSPYLAFHLPLEKFGNFSLDLTLALFTAMVMAISLYQIRLVRVQEESSRGKIGLTGVFAALVAGACPCYYLVPLLSVAGGIGGVLGGVGIAFYSMQLPIKLASLGLLGFVTFSLERSLRASCDIRNRVG